MRLWTVLAIVVLTGCSSSGDGTPATDASPSEAAADTGAHADTGAASDCGLVDGAIDLNCGDHLPPGRVSCSLQPCTEGVCCPSSKDCYDPKTEPDFCK